MTQRSEPCDHRGIACGTRAAGRSSIPYAVGVVVPCLLAVLDPEPSPDALSAEGLAVFRRCYDPGDDMRHAAAAVLRLHGREDRHIRSDLSLAAARAVHHGIARDTTFRMYDDRDHGLQSTIGAPECLQCPHHGDQFANGLELDDVIWNDVLAWLQPRLKANGPRP